MIKSTLRPLGLKWLTPAGLGFIPFFSVLYEVHAPDAYRRFLIIGSREGY